MSYKLFIDDERDVSFVDFDPTGWLVARSVWDMLDIMVDHGAPGHISFDHDLGADEDTGYDIAKMLVNMDMDETHDFNFPDGFTYASHSMNPVGKKNILCYLDNYFRMKKEA